MKKIGQLTEGGGRRVGRSGVTEAFLLSKLALNEIQKEFGGNDTKATA